MGRLGDIGRAEIDDNGLRLLDLGDAKFVVGADHLQLLGQGRFTDGEV